MQRGATKALPNIFQEPGTCFPLYLFLLVPRQKRMPLQSGLEILRTKKICCYFGIFFKITSHAKSRKNAHLKRNFLVAESLRSQIFTD
ncbi:hypothetical protein OA84_02305 [Kaistella solincola]|uniref:Uncharacterized protein n=1 Tax=Kaistella solincola TaxID=510955 RepID=A0ABR4ZSM2_9FLAO|nr:hypothetical protein OA84_02305 [Kaistella solincola]